MSHFNRNHLTFYIGAIAIAIGTFAFTTSYGESNLKAPKDISGIYKLESSNLPDCLNGQSLQLVIQQSGGFINAALIPVGDRTKIYRLSGRWQSPNLTLSGHGSHFPTCKTSLIDITAQIESKILKGNINVATNSAKFAATLQVPESAPKSSH